MWFFKIKSTALKKKKKDCIFIISGIKRSERLVSCSYWGFTHYSWVRVPYRQVTQSPPLLIGLHPTWFLWAFSAQPWKKEEGPSELSPTLWFNHIMREAVQLCPFPPIAHKHLWSQKSCSTLGQISTLLRLGFCFCFCFPFCKKTTVFFLFLFLFF